LQRRPIQAAPLLFAAARLQQVSGELYQGQWYDIGTPERLKSLDQQLSAMQD
jgi:MurNAc alpha-1-phosphate uridylyltransferase